MSRIQAAIGREQLKKLDRLTKERIDNCSYLTGRLNGFPGIRSPRVRAESSHVYYVQPFLYNENEAGVERNKFIAAVKAELPVTELREAEGQQISCGYVKPLYLSPLFQKA